MNFKLLNVWLRLKVAVLFFLTVTLVPVIAADLDEIVISEEVSWRSQAKAWQNYISQYPTFSKFTDHSTLKENKELILPSGISLYLGLADRLNRTLPFLAQESITYTISTLDELLKIRSSALRDATQEERDIILAATAQTALYRYKEHKGDTEELFTVDYWTDYFTDRQEEEKFDFSSTTVNDTLHTRAVAAAIATRKVYRIFPGFPQLQKVSGMRPKMFNNLVKEVDKAASSVMIQHTLTAAKADNIVTQFNLATMLARKENPPEKRQQAYGLFEEIAVNPEVKDPNIQAMALLQMARLLQEEIIKPKKYLSLDDLTPKKQEKASEWGTEDGPYSGWSWVMGYPKKEGSSLTKTDNPTTKQYITLLYFDAVMIARNTAVLSPAGEALRKAIEKDGDTSQIKKAVEGFKDRLTFKFGKDENQDEDGEYAFRMARVFFMGIRGLYEKDEKQAFEWCFQAAEKGNIKAQVGVAYMWNEGIGTTKNPKEAFKWYLEAAQQGNADAQYAVARMLEKGQGTSKNIDEAYRRYSELTEHIAARALYAGMLYDKARQDEDVRTISTVYLKRAFERYLKAARYEHVEAQFAVARMLRKGKGTKKNLKEAFKWYLKLAQQGHAIAQYNVARMLDQDDVVTDKNLEEVFKWSLRSAQQGFVDAQFVVGSMYKDGIGTAKDVSEAYQWHKKAADKGHKDAKQRLAEYVEEY